jgi:predicted DsbA family dithiol-disulfide isomerase
LAVPEQEALMEKVKFHFDPRCPWCYQTSQWVRRLDELGTIEADWGVFSLEIVNAPEGTDPESIDAVSGPALRTAILIRDSEGSKAIGPFYKALGKRIWESYPAVTDMVEATREALVEIGLDPGLLDKALADPATWTAVIEEHRGLIETNKSFGVPTIVLDGGTGPAIFGPVISEMPDDETSVEMWEHVAWLTRYQNFAELKRDRQGPPDLAGWRWRTEQQAKAQAQAT